MGGHAEVVKLVEAIDGALNSLTVGNARQAVLTLYQVIPVFEDSRYASNQEVWQLHAPFLSVTAVCAAKSPQDDGLAIQLFAKAVRLQLNRVRP
jgi:hypothetical protein